MKERSPVLERERKWDMRFKQATILVAVAQYLVFAIKLIDRI